MRRNKCTLCDCMSNNAHAAAVSGYIKKPTQEQRILDFLRERGPAGAYVYEFMTPRPTGLGIAQYSARIWGLRQKGHVIENKKPGWFVLTYDAQSPTGQGVLI